METFDNKLTKNVTSILEDGIQVLIFSKGKMHVGILDKNQETIDFLNKHKLSLHSKGYMVYKKQGKIKLYHHELIESEKYVQFINFNKLDCRKQNLRPCGDVMLQAYQYKPRKNNKAQLRGAFFSKREGLYFSAIQHEKIKYFLGRFKTAEEAHDAYVHAHIRLKKSLSPYLIDGID